jgi:hypothetical protein
VTMRELGVCRSTGAPGWGRTGTRSGSSVATLSKKEVFGWYGTLQAAGWQPVEGSVASVVGTCEGERVG